MSVSLDDLIDGLQDILVKSHANFEAADLWRERMEEIGSIARNLIIKAGQEPADKDLDEEDDDPPTIVEWRNIQGKLHRDDGPAVTFADGSQAWYRDGKLHRDGGPAVTGADGSQSWYRNGQLHRDNGPAVTYASGSQSWWRDGECYRFVGSPPAVIHANGKQEWFRHGEKHRGGDSFFSVEVDNLEEGDDKTPRTREHDDSMLLDIVANGVLSPLVVGPPIEPGRYRVVEGNARLRVLRRLQQFFGKPLTVHCRGEEANRRTIDIYI